LVYLQLASRVYKLFVVCTPFHCPSPPPVVSATAFYKQQPVLDFLCEVLELSNVDEQRSLSDSQRVSLPKKSSVHAVVLFTNPTCTPTKFLL